ncbi:hypothetical protein BDA99DRAFT_555957 [Phascolomyces articulosus]|uniref:Uncharacterized protein n=1 Tax=Phascolomyces articulosus TaxID=60185 RepID=A0AAD5KL41_9FUNG|nr:hypothetical protein BDA99DRAFT_555957 [Phascolomyces articulosus]
MHLRLHVPSTTAIDPLSLRLKQLLKSKPSSPQRIEQLCTFWPVICQTLSEVDALQHPDVGRTSFFSSQPGISFVNWISPPPLEAGSYKGLYDLDSLTDKHMSQGPYHPKKQADLYWAHNSVAEALNLFHYQWLPIDKRATEADVIRRVFPFIEKCFDDRKDTGHIFDPNTAAINDVTVPELAINGLDMMVEMITIPKHYVCILNKYATNDDQTIFIYTSDIPTPPSVIPPCPPSPRPVSKAQKRKFIDADG